MRFDNPIYDHGFVFPDIADFPDVSNEKRYIGDGKVEYVSMMKKAINRNDLTMFEQGYKSYMKIPDAKLFDRLNKMFQFYAEFKKSRIESNIPSNKIYEDLYENGISYLNFDTKDLKSYCQSHIDELLSKPDWTPAPGQFDRSKQLDDTFKKYLHNMFNNCGIIDAVSKYNKSNRRLKVANVVLHIATPTDQNWKQFLYDCKTVTKTTNLHIDPKEDVIKAMLYLDDVTENDGPFSYVEKSHRWVYDDLQNIFGRAITTGSYCYTPESRAVVFQLPKQLRVSHNFGRLLLDGTEEQERILEQEKIFTSDKGNLCVFDPAGMHRGGICKTGTRIALQILMK